MRRPAALLCALAAAAGCGAPPPLEEVRPDRCDATVMGACVVSNAGPVDARAIERSLRLALAYWSAPDEAVAGWAIVYEPQPIACGATADAAGCTWWDANRAVALQVLDPACPETAQLVHELGHVLHHDGGHEGPWWDWEGEQAATWEIVRSEGASPGCAGSLFYVSRPETSAAP